MSANPVLVVMGVSGSGKSTVAELLAGQLGWDYLEGDDLHPAANVAKMSAGIPLDDDDRWPWLDKIADWIVAHQIQDRPGVVTCSALKRSYRDRLTAKSALPDRQSTIFVYLEGSREAIAARLAARSGHFMPTALLDSQFAALEPPQADENALVIGLDGTPTEQVAEIIQRLELNRPDLAGK